MQLLCAMDIAISAYGHSLSEDGKPAIFHPLRVMMHDYGDEGDDHRIVGVLHDLLEDFPQWTINDLKCQGFGSHIVEAIDAITRRKDEEYMTYIERCANNFIARDVKLADLKDNMARCVTLSPKHQSLYQRYATARDYIQASIMKEIRK